MKNRLASAILFFVFALVCTACAENSTFASDDSLQDFFRKSEVTIVITDSGLGGLSILVDAVERSKIWKSFQKIDFVFFNALFSNLGGYNTLKSYEEKVAVFNSVLNSIEVKYNPDLILIGCNTLSAIYDDTHFAAQTKIPVRGIIDAGVDVASDALKAHPESKIILFATQTTVSQNTHKNRLAKMGFLPERIVYQACPELARYIEESHNGEETEMLILAYVDEALKKLNGHNVTFLVSLNCTHYGYSLDLWNSAFHDLGVKPLAVLNPNSKMNDFLFRLQYRDRYKNTDITVRAVSMVEIKKNKIESLGSFLRPLSRQTAEAFQKYEWKKDLFEWQNYVKNRE
jgi:glutamate racemase